MHINYYLYQKAISSEEKSNGYKILKKIFADSPD